MTAARDLAACGRCWRFRCSASRSRPSTRSWARRTSPSSRSVIETVLTLVFVGVFSRLPRRPRRGRRAPRRRTAPALRNVAAGVVAGVGAFAVDLGRAVAPAARHRVTRREQIRLTPEAHGGDVVTVILADFRGLDTMVEITVLAVAVIGVAQPPAPREGVVSPDPRRRGAAAAGPALMLAAALIVKGYTDVGDGFSAGVIVALAVGLRYVVLGPELDRARTCRSLRHAPTRRGRRAADRPRVRLRPRPVR